MYSVFLSRPDFQVNELPCSGHFAKVEIELNFVSALGISHISSWVKGHDCVMVVSVTNLQNVTLLLCCKGTGIGGHVSECARTCQALWSVPPSNCTVLCCCTSSPMEWPPSFKVCGTLTSEDVVECNHENEDGISSTFALFQFNARCPEKKNTNWPRLYDYEYEIN